MKASIFIIALTIVLCESSVAQEQNVVRERTKTHGPKAMKYKALGGDVLRRFAWRNEYGEGKYGPVVLFTPSSQLDEDAMGYILEKADGAYRWYKDATGREPADTKYSAWLGGLPVAVRPLDVHGHGHLGRCGLEVSSRQFEMLYEQAKTGKLGTTIVLHELGRNFWFWTDSLGSSGLGTDVDIAKAYAIFMGYGALEAVCTEAECGRIDPDSYERLKKMAQGAEFLVKNWDDLLRKGVPRGQFNRHDEGMASFLAGCLFSVRDEYGGDNFIRRFCRAAGKLPPGGQRNASKRMQNLAVALNGATDKDLTEVFVRWKWPIAGPARRRIASSNGAY